MEPKISIIAAIGGETRALGKNTNPSHRFNLLWDIPADLKHFKDLTFGHSVIMGRRTFESIGRPLPNRINFIVSRDTSYVPNGTAVVCTSLEEAIEKAKEREVNEIFIIGGSQIFVQAMPLADRLYLTLVEGEYPDADVFFPDYSSFTKVIEKEPHNGYTFLTLER